VFSDGKALGIADTGNHRIVICEIIDFDL